MTTTPAERPAPTTAAQALARWWADHLRNVAPQDNGDESSTGGLAAAMMLTLAVDAVAPAEEGDRFEVALTEAFRHDLDRWGRADAWSDYGPDGLLCDAAQAAGIVLKAMALPIKSATKAESGCAWAKLGYRGSWRAIWAATPERLALERRKEEYQEVLNTLYAECDQTEDYRAQREHISALAAAQMVEKYGPDWNQEVPVAAAESA